MRVPPPAGRRAQGVTGKKGRGSFGEKEPLPFLILQGARTGTLSCAPSLYTEGLIFWFTLKRLVGSYRFLTVTRRS